MHSGLQGAIKLAKIVNFTFLGANAPTPWRMKAKFGVDEGTQGPKNLKIAPAVNAIPAVCTACNPAGKIIYHISAVF